MWDLWGLGHQIHQGSEVKIGHQHHPHVQYHHCSEVMIGHQYHPHLQNHGGSGVMVELGDLGALPLNLGTVQHHHHHPIYPMKVEHVELVHLVHLPLNMGTVQHVQLWDLCVCATGLYIWIYRLYESLVLGPISCSHGMHANLTSWNMQWPFSYFFIHVMTCNMFVWCWCGNKFVHPFKPTPLDMVPRDLSYSRCWHCRCGVGGALLFFAFFSPVSNHLFGWSAKSFIMEYAITFFTLDMTCSTFQLIQQCNICNMCNN